VRLSGNLDNDTAALQCLHDRRWEGLPGHPETAALIRYDPATSHLLIREDMPSVDYTLISSTSGLGEVLLKYLAMYLSHSTASVPLVPCNYRIDK